MREIYYRAKTEGIGEWVYGYYYSDCDCAGIAHFIYSPKSDPDSSSHRYDIVPETVGQYTGLKDRNDTMIFEGDIIERHGERVVVIWQKTRFVALKKNKRPMTWQYVTNSGKVVGNIHDSPELMEKNNNE